MRPPSPARAAALLAVLLGAALAVPAAGAPAEAERRVVRGSDGWLFIAQDWSVPCQVRGSAADVADRVAGFVAAVARSGREVVHLQGPDKGTARAGNVPRSAPLRDCGEREKAALRSALADRLGPRTLDVRPDLAAAAARSPVYWRQDTHWTPTGAAAVARRLAARWDPALARALRLEPATWSRRGDLAQVLGVPGTETVEGWQLVNPGVRVVLEPRVGTGSGQGRRLVTATPEGGQVLPGRTLFLSDSFTDVGIAQFGQLSQETVHLWTGPDTPAEDVVREVEAADRVVVLRVERFASDWRPYDEDVVRALQTLTPRSTG